jgi:hypothetical protein
MQMLNFADSVDLLFSLKFVVKFFFQMVLIVRWLKLVFLFFATD